MTPDSPVEPPQPVPVPPSIADPPMRLVRLLQVQMPGGVFRQWLF